MSGLRPIIAPGWSKVGHICFRAMTLSVTPGQDRHHQPGGRRDAGHNQYALHESTRFAIVYILLP